MTPFIQNAALCFLTYNALPESFLAKFWSVSFRFSVSIQKDDLE